MPVQRCPGCNQDLPTRPFTEVRVNRVMTYTVLDQDQLVFCYGGKWWHRGCADPANIQSDGRDL